MPRAEVVTRGIPANTGGYPRQFEGLIRIHRQNAENIFFPFYSNLQLISKEFTHLDIPIVVGANRPGLLVKAVVSIHQDSLPTAKVGLQVIRHNSYVQNC